MKPVFLIAIALVFGIFAISLGVIPADAHTGHPNLIVSAENAEFDNLFAGFQVVEIVVDDPDISDTTSIQIEPDVMIDGNSIRMVQATDGKWYGYVADKNQAQFADSTVTVSGTGFDFGEFCSSSTDPSVFGIDVSNTDGIAIARPYSGTVSSTNGEGTLQSCSGGSVTLGDVTNNVVRNSPTLVSSSTIPLGQIGIESDIFPIIQLFNFDSMPELYILYDKSTGTQEVILEYAKWDDTLGYYDSDYVNVIVGQDIEININNFGLNIDPTSKDVWTFLINYDENLSKTYYRLFDEFGTPESDGNNPFTITKPNSSNSINNLFLLSTNCDICESLFNPQSNLFQTLTGDKSTLSLSSSDDFFTVIESNDNSSRFSTLDDNGDSSVKWDFFIRSVQVGIVDMDDNWVTSVNPIFPPPVITTNSASVLEDTCLELPLTLAEEYPSMIPNSFNAYLTQDTQSNFIHFGSSTQNDSDCFNNMGILSAGREIGDFWLHLPTPDTLWYHPEPDFFGTDVISIEFLEMDFEPYTISITVTPVQDTPVTGTDVSGITNEDTPTNITLSGIDVDGDVITFEVVTEPAHGVLSGTAPNLTYTPNLHYFGNDEFTFNTSDGQLDGNVESVIITINPVADIPIANANSDQSVDGSSVVQLDGTQSYDNDVEDTLTYSWIQTAGDPVTLTDSTNITPQFTAPSNNGQLTFMLTVSDGVATSNPDVVNIYVGESVPEPTAPPAPTSLNTNISDSTVVLTWQNPDDGGSAITDYVVEYKSANSSWSTYDDGVSSDTVSIIRDLENNVTYQFRISAVNSVGTSDSSSLISATPISSAPVSETPTVPEPEPTVPEPEPTVPEPELGIASFVDQTKNPQSYVDRYNNEPAYKQWFDDNYSQYNSIYQAVGLDEPSEESVLENPVQPEPEMISEPEYTPEPVFAPEPVMEQEVQCGPGTELVNDVCQAIPNVNSEQKVNCGPGTESVNGICEVIQTAESEEGGGCLIATATYGSEMATEVQQLRELRDNQLLNTESGTAFMGMFNDVYYSFSPTIADMERENPYFKEAVKLAITPMISSLSLMENAESESEVLGIGISVIMLNLGMYLGVPAIVVVGIRKKF